ncbi:hypothetical protein A2899_00060 [Candidatus Amesbacteria bacterium RIFCSPLOWO2_01_FULL_49_25]|uniref:HAD family hydrolase n=1 Tax=Candidatus Amesbacteria bacterium RIFCSPHIGHO2_01_FULL_48_32b TaxID=1797253 RepID=A0A1F4YIW7_9BACT|nr:MAG: hypothetical protein A2876_04805 [Candidatus Amesbacteria bacterium RIFCSPHIGHO2_01_FULL_48_32b]OGD07015.1 MAG: hypothetical protein A2899_00060 [Candidatus Amesbacteria bacterium RIFCSPLOWO2_01_FULL_49_25]
MIEAVIFDLDGTVLDNEGEWEEAFCEVAKKFSVTNSGFSIDGWMHEPGIGITPNWRRYFPSDLAKVDELSRETWEAYKLKTQEVKVKIREGVEKLVEKIKARGWMTALTTGSSWHVVEGELEELGLYLAFDVTTTGEEVLVQKPDPEIYLLTVQKLGLEPGECVVVEDAVAGVRAAVEAGCLSVGLESAYAPEKLLKSAGATWVVKEMGEVADLITRT